MRPATRSLCLGLAVGAFFLAPDWLGAQETPPPESMVPVPAATADTAAGQRADTIQPGFGAAISPRTTAAGSAYEWDREAMFATGALTLADLLDRVPGMTVYRTGWLPSPKFAAVNGDMGRVRVFVDGLEVDNLDPKSDPLLDLTTIDIWTLERVSVERFANEYRVHARTWQATKTEPYTRTDVFAGDENTNVYRGFYGNRWSNGAGLQLAAQQFSSRSRLGGNGDALSLHGRAGVARERWSLDIGATRRGATRNLQPTFSVTDGLSIPHFRGVHALYYARAAVRDPARGVWAELTASRQQFEDEGRHVTPAEAFASRLVADTTDTATSRHQYLARAGITRGLLGATVAGRVRAIDGETYLTPSLRLEAGTSRALLVVDAESDRYRRSNVAHFAAALSPTPFLALNASWSMHRPYDSASAFAPVPWNAFRAEVGVRVVRPWLVAGFIARDTAFLAGPLLVDTAYKAISAGRTQGFYAGVRGALYRDVNVDMMGTVWDSAFYQPRYQARSEINVDTRWLSRFPSGSFGLKAALIHEHRSSVAFPTLTGPRRTDASNVVSALLEIRILRGVASYQVRNMTAINHQLVPDFFMHRVINVYGIRWEFWN